MHLLKYIIISTILLVLYFIISIIELVWQMLLWIRSSFNLFKMLKMIKKCVIFKTGKVFFFYKTVPIKAEKS